MRTFVFAIALLLTISFVPASAQQAIPFGGDRIVTVMTRNVYHGVDAEIFRVPGATSLEDLLDRVAAVFRGYEARNFPERAKALAAEIEATQPALIGLQEAVLVRTGRLFDPAPAETVASITSNSFSTPSKSATCATRSSPRSVASTSSCRALSGSTSATQTAR